MTDTERRQQANFVDAQLADARKCARQLRERDDPTLIEEMRIALCAALRTVDTMRTQLTPPPGRLL